MRKVLFITLDNTLITTKSGRQFPLHSEDWQFKRQSIEAIKEYSNKGYLICIIANQHQIIAGLITENTFRYKVENIITIIKTDLKISHNAIVYKYCKDVDSYNYLPKPGMILELALEYKIDLKNSIFIGNDLYDKDIINFININYIPVSNLNYPL